MTDKRDESLIDKVKNAFGMGGDEHDHDHDHGDHEHTVGGGAGAGGTFDRDLGDSMNRPAGPDYGANDTRLGSTETIDVSQPSDVTHASGAYGAPAATGPVEPAEPVDRPLTDDLPEAEDRAEGWAGVDDALGGAGERSTYGTSKPEDPDRR